MIVAGIIGASFCGSTLVSRVLAGLPGVISPGEIHRLLGIKNGSIPYSGWICSRHGPACEVLTRDLCDKVTEENIYDVVAGAFSRDSGMPVKLFVSSDKSFHGQYHRYVRKPDVYLILTRDVVSHTASLARTAGTEEAALSGLRNFYMRELDVLETIQALSVHIELSAFLHDPQQALVWLHESTGGLFPQPVGVFDYNADYHHSGGNYEAHTTNVIDQTRPERRTLEVLTPKDVLDGMSEASRRIAELKIPHLV